jgi:hypothetical protein
MRTPRVLLVSVLLAFAFAMLRASAPYMPADAVKPGMTGIGKTVFQGSRVEDFKIVVLGVLKNYALPQRTIIVARLEGGPLATAGVIAGMSGSPVYIDGKLVGAIAYSLGSFPREPIAGITPIAEMIADADARAPRTTRRVVSAALPLTRDDMLDVVRRALPRLQPMMAAQDDTPWLGPAGPAGQDAASGIVLKPIETPLVFGGFSDAMRVEVADLFQPVGFVAVANPTGGTGTQGQGPNASRGALQPGDAVGVELISGDLTLGATGTVTEVTADRVYALGHSLYNLGPTRFPMTRAYIHAVLPSLESSTKIATTGDVVGTIRQDRSAVVAGTLDAGPRMVPLTLTVTGARGSPRTFRFGLAQDDLLTPLLAYTAIANVLQAHERSQGAATVAVTGRATVAGHEPVFYDDIFVEDSPAVTVASAIAAPLVTVMGNEFEPADLGAIDLQVKVSEERESLTIQRAWLDTDRPKAGGTCTLKIALHGYRGQEETRSLPIEIPARASGSLTLLVTDATHLAQWEQREMRTPAPWTLDQILRAVNRARRGNRLYVRLVGSAPGALVDGEQLPTLPPSVLAVYEAGRSSGSFSPLRSALLGEWEITTGVAVLGSRQLTFNVDPER